MTLLPWLPALVLLDQYNGDWPKYCDAVYASFCADFITSKPKLNGWTVTPQKFKEPDGKEQAFWHLISEGITEADRTPDIRRYERIKWPKSMIEKVLALSLPWWYEPRGNKQMLHIALEDFSYVVVMSRRKGYFLLWTAYCTERESRRATLRGKFDSFTKMARAAITGGSETPST